MDRIEEVIRKTTGENQGKTDWTKAWSSRYPILEKYQKEVDAGKYAGEIRKLLDDIRESYGYSEEDAMLVLKDILYHEYKDNRKKGK